MPPEQGCSDCDTAFCLERGEYSMRKLTWLAMASAALLLGQGGRLLAGPIITTYTSQAAFDAAVGQTFTEPFNSTGLQPFTGVVTSAGFIGPARGVLTGSVWNDRVTLSGGESTTFSYKPGDLFGAGALWDTSPAGEGQGLHLTINLVGGGTASVAQIGPIDGGFFGFTSSEAFTSFTITAGTNPGVAETFDMDNLQFAPFAAAVPEPSTLALFGLTALAGAGYRAWRRRK